MPKRFASLPGLFILLLIVATTILLLFVAYHQRIWQSDDILTPNAARSGQQVIQAGQYESAVVDLMARVTAAKAQSPVTAELSVVDQAFWQTELQAIKGQLLDLWVPAEYRQLHLDLAIALDALERSVATSDPEQFAAAQAQFATLLEQYPWLTQ